MQRVLLCLFAALFLLAACSDKPVRHLASDAALITPGQTTREEVIHYLGKPNGHRAVSPGVEEYVYYEDQEGVFNKLPMVGDWVDPEGYEMIVITLEGDMVTNCEFRAFNEADQDWVDDFTWDEVK